MRVSGKVHRLSQTLSGNTTKWGLFFNIVPLVGLTLLPLVWQHLDPICQKSYQADMTLSHELYSLPSYFCLREITVDTLIIIMNTYIKYINIVTIYSLDEIASNKDMRSWVKFECVFFFLLFLFESWGTGYLKIKLQRIKLWILYSFLKKYLLKNKKKGLSVVRN